MEDWQPVQFSPELSLVRACCRWSIFSDNQAEISRLCECVDWDRFIEATRRHRVEGLVADALRKSGASPPEQVARVVSANAAAVAALNLRFTATTIQIRQLFSTAGVPVLFIKGLSLSKLAYGDPYLKMSSDIDILVAADDLSRATRLLSELQFELALPRVPPHSSELLEWHKWQKESVWHSPDGAITVELHTALADNPNLIPTIGMYSPRQAVEIGPSDTVETLQTEDLFAYLCVHGASSAWFRLKWITDLSALIVKTTDMNVDRLFQEAESRGAGRAAGVALKLAEELFQLAVPANLSDRLSGDLANRLLVELAFRQLANPVEPTRRRYGTISIHLSQPLLLRGWKNQLGELKRQAIELLRRKLST